MTLDQLRVFLAAAESGSFTRAARRLTLSQSTVSFHVAGLEASLGTRLLDRGRGGVTPTRAGEALLPRARALLALAAESEAAVSAESEVAGEVSVAASTIPATYLLPEALARLRAAAPSVNVRLSVSDSGGALRALLDGACELAVSGAPPSDPRVLASSFAEDEVVLVGLPGASAAAGGPMVLREAESGTRRAVEALLPPAGCRVEVGSSEAARRCVLAGLGVGFLSTLAVAEDLAAGRLVILPVEGAPVRRAFHVARLRQRTPSPAARALWRVLCDYGVRQTS